MEANERCLETVLISRDARPRPRLKPNRWLETAAKPLRLDVKDHRQRIPRFVIRRYLEKSIQKKLFCHLQSLQIKTIFQEKKTIINSISEKNTVAVYLWS